MTQRILRATFEMLGQETGKGLNIFIAGSETCLNVRPTKVRANYLGQRQANE